MSHRGSEELLVAFIHVQNFQKVVYMLFHLIFASTGKQRSNLTEEIIQSTHDLIHDK